MAKYANKIGAILYVLWGLIHIVGGLAIMMQTSLPAKIAMQATARSPNEFDSIANTAVNGIVSYHGFNLIWFGLFAIFVAIVLIWRNLQLGYWLNFLVLGMVEFGLITFMLIPGHMRWADGSIGLGLFFLALVFSSVGSLNQANQPLIRAV